MSRRRGRQAYVPPEEHPDERWMASYTDMVTVLMCLFIVLFAMSSVDAQKFEKLKNSLASGFGVVNEGKVDTAEGVVVTPEKVNAELEGMTDLELAMAETDELLAIKARISKDLAREGLLDAVRFAIDERGLSIRLVGAEAFFRPDSAELTDQTVQVLDTIRPVVSPTGREVAVEGHTARVDAPNPRYWELSSERATNVVRNLIGPGGVRPERIRAVGFGSARPLTPGKTADELRLNRRTDVVVLSDESETVRALIPGILKSRAT
ncbi:flagellar motor protein MotB [Pseudarthrobacter sp. NPDC092439]|uniref:OmpA/MotB family protein n=1 Tax=unclassified Pseudarthrobacter TaxID=2647000 RepID=UPI00382FC669